MMKRIPCLILFLQTLVFGSDVIPVAVIGSGPAGLSAALVTGRERIDTHVFLGSRPGGPVNAVTCLGNWPGSVKGKGHVVIERLFDQLKRFDVQLHAEEITQVDFSSIPHRLYTSEGKEYAAQTVIIATGAYPRRLNLPREDVCETYVYKPDVSRFEGKTVAVVGSGTDAAKKARILSKAAAKVYLLVRGPQMQKPFMAEKLKKRNTVEILYNTSVQQLVVRDEKLTHIYLSNGELLSIDSLVLAVGIIPNSSLVQGHLQLDEEGFILLEGRTQKTSVPGVFAAGNVTDPRYRQAGISAGDGMKAGYDALEFLKSGSMTSR